MKHNYLDTDLNDIDEKIGRVMGVFVTATAAALLIFGYFAVRWVIG